MVLRFRHRLFLHALLACSIMSFSLLSLAPSGALAGGADMFQREVRYPLEHRFNLVKKVQTALAEKGFDPGRIDGMYGPRTKAALEKYQKENGLSGDGHLTEESVRHLGLM